MGSLPKSGPTLNIYCYELNSKKFQSFLCNRRISADGQTVEYH